MKVHELIRLLECEDQDAAVHFAYNYGDHWRTKVAPEVENVEAGYVTHSDYHSMDKVAREDADLDDESVRRVVILQ